MSNEQAVNPAGQAAPAVPAPPAAAAPPPAAPPPAAPPPPAVDAGTEPPWLNGRIAQAKTSATTELLKTLGAASVDEAKAAVEAARVAADAKKSAEQRAAELDGQLKSASQQRDELAGVVKARAELELKALTPEQLAAVTGIAGDDPAKQLRTIDALKPTWAKPAVASPGAAPLAAPASTTQAATPPPAVNPPAAVDHAAVYDELNKSNPMLAAHYLTLHGPAVFEGRKKRST